ncbi:MAG: PAS domain S-box protein [Acidiferrobacterales bacterium]
MGDQGIRMSGESANWLTAQSRSVIDNVVDGVVIIDRRGLVAAFNPAAERMFGYRAEEVLGREVKILMPEPDGSRHQGFVDGYVRTGDAKIIGVGREVIGRRKDGSVFPMYLSVGEMAGGDQPRFIGILRDVTEHKDLERQLRQSHKMEALGQLTGGVAHDFNNLLAVLVMDLEELDELTQGQAQLQELVNEARDVVRSGGELTRVLLAFAKRQNLEPSELDIGELVGRMIGMFRRTLGEAIEVETIKPAGLWKVWVDSAQLENSLLNLALNARDAMPDGGRLTIELQNIQLDHMYAASHSEVVPGEYVLLNVADTGHGMPSEVAEKAFDPFFTTRESAGGNGLGLSMVYGFVKQSSGHVSIYSEVDYGTTVSMFLPRVQAEATSDSDRSATDELPVGCETIVLVEDYPRLRRRAKQLLTELGYNVFDAKNGNDALAKLKSVQNVDLLFTDVVMPGGMTGPQLVETAWQRWPDLKVLYTTGHAEHLGQGGDSDLSDADPLRKPYSKRDVATAIRRVLDAK